LAAIAAGISCSELMPTAIAVSPRREKPLARAINAGIGKLKFPTKNSGVLTLDEYVVHPNHRVQGVMILHHGKVVYEAYPGINPEQVHVWMSAAKTTVGLIIAQLEVEGKIDLSKPVTYYVPDLKGSAWDKISVLDAANMATGLDLEEALKSIVDPQSIIVRFFSAEFGQPVPDGKKVESWIDLVREAKPLNEKPGAVSRYTSAATTVLNYLAELVENKPWIDIFAERVWSKMGVRGPVLINLTPEGTAVAHGLQSTTLEDFARFGALFAPRWKKVAYEQVVSPKVLKRIQTSGNSDAYNGAGMAAGVQGYFDEKPLAHAFQFDAVFKDGALWKHGNLGQGCMSSNDYGQRAV
jgi:CubicO group peptidase (beta-lactamase class C family)